MSPLHELVYALLVQLIRAYKFAEFQVLRLLTPLLIRKSKQIAELIGVAIHCPGDKPWTEADTKRVLSLSKYDTIFHFTVHDNSFFPRIANTGSLGFGETYMDGLWEFREDTDIAHVCKRVMENNLTDIYWNWWNRSLEWIELCAFNLQKGTRRVFQVGKEHYDLGNDMYEAMLDPWMQYTCGYWKNAKNLNEAQVNKMRLLAEKLNLSPGMKVLDIGCGWGMLCKFLAENYGVECVGVTISEEGVKYGTEVNKGLPVQIRLQDYRDVNEKFDRIVSVGMFEHVGFQNYREFFQVAHRCLHDDGIFLLHTIGRNHSNVPRSERFYHTYIFPNGNLPNPTDLTTATQGLFILEDWHNFGLDYSKTLASWHSNFVNMWGKLQHVYGERFRRMWTYYLNHATGMFMARRLHVYQMVLSKDGLKQGYNAAR